MKHLALVLFWIALVGKVALAQEICVDSSSGAATKAKCTKGVVSIASDSGTVTDSGSSLTVKYAVINVDGADSDAVVAAVAGKTIRVLGYTIVCSGAVNVTFEDGDGTDLTGAMPFAANGGAVSSVNSLGVFETPVANKSLNILKSAAESCDGHLTYVEVG